MPLNFFNVVRLVPYVQGQVVGWTNQIGGGPLGHQPSGAIGRAWGGVGMPRRDDAVEAVPERRERALQRPRPEPQDQLLRRRPRRLLERPAQQPRRPGRPRRQHLRVRPPLLRPDELRRRHPAAPVRPPAPDPPPHDLADHRHDRHPGVDQDGPARHPPAAPDQARPDGRRRIIDYMTLDLDDHLLPRLRARQLRQAVRPEHVQLAVVPRRPDEHHLLRLVRVLEAGRQPAALSNNMRERLQPHRAERDHDRGSRSAGRRGRTSSSATRSSTPGRSRPRPSTRRSATGSARSGTVRSRPRTTSATRSSWARCSRSPGSAPTT